MPSTKKYQQNTKHILWDFSHRVGNWPIVEQMTIKYMIDFSNSAPKQVDIGSIGTEWQL